jgi:hypothetical protein
MHTYSVRGATVLHASTFDANIMIMIIICSRAAWYTVYVGAARGPEIAPVVILITGMEMRPITLQYAKRRMAMVELGADAGGTRCQRR